MSGRDADARLAPLAVALAFIGGYVDAVGFVALARVFTGHITGNTVMLAIDVAEGSWAGIPQRMLAVVMFLAGIVLGAMLNERMTRRGQRSRLAPLFVLEAGLLVPLILSDETFVGGAAHAPLARAWPLYALTALAAIALGLQNGTLRRVGRSAVHTTYISGAVTALTEGVVGRWFGHHDRAPGTRPVRDAARPASTRDANARAKLWLLAGIASGFAAGAMVGVALYLGRGLDALAVPIVLLVMMAWLDARRPFPDTQ